MNRGTCGRVFGIAWACALVVTGGAAQGATRYALTDLNLAPYSSVFAINDPGQIVGTVGVVLPGHPNADDLPFPGAPRYFSGTLLNNAGQVAGYFPEPSGGPLFEAGLWTPGGGFVDLGSGRPTGLNDAGEVVGFSESSGYRPWLWTPAVGSQVTVGPGAGRATDINNAGTIVFDGAVYARGSSTGSPTGLPYGGRINNLGRVTEGDGVYTPGRGLTSLGFLGDRPTSAFAINDLGQVVGRAGDDVDIDPGRAFVWSEADGLQDLNALLDESGNGWVLYSAVDVNNRGQIIGYGRSPLEAYNAVFLLTPVPEPGSSAAAGLALVGLCAPRRRRR
jgi:probable HAF family extracellular repeat protein